MNFIFQHLQNIRVVNIWQLCNYKSNKCYQIFFMSFQNLFFVPAPVPNLESKSPPDVTLPEPDLRHEEENFNISIPDTIFQDNREDEPASEGVTNQNRGSITRSD